MCWRKFLQGNNQPMDSLPIDVHPPPQITLECLLAILLALIAIGTHASKLKKLRLF